MILLNAVASGFGAAYLGGARLFLAFFVEPAGTITGGKVQIEEARAEDYAGTWSPIGSEITLATGVLSGVRAEGSFLWVRARITSPVTGPDTPSVTVQLTGTRN